MARVQPTLDIIDSPQGPAPAEPAIEAPAKVGGVIGAFMGTNKVPAASEEQDRKLMGPDADGFPYKHYCPRGLTRPPRIWAIVLCRVGPREARNRLITEWAAAALLSALLATMTYGQISPDAPFGDDWRSRVLLHSCYLSFLASTMCCVLASALSIQVQLPSTDSALAEFVVQHQVVMETPSFLFITASTLFMVSAMFSFVRVSPSHKDTIAAGVITAVSAVSLAFVALRGTWRVETRAFREARKHLLNLTD